ncbi:PQ-loop repeat-containing protein 3 [Paramecium bursaria]
MIYLIFLILISKVNCEEDYLYTIFTQRCFKILFDDQIWSQECLMETASRILSILIVAFSILNQMPQIYKIIKFKSVSGLAFNSTYNESYLITFNIAYNLHKGTSFVLYGENVFVLLQFFIIMILFYIFDDLSKRRLYLRKGIIYLIINIPLILGYGPDDLFNLTIYINMILCNHNIQLVLMSRLPQILLNIKNKSTGQLAFLTQIQNQAGVITRTFTLYVSSGDWLYGRQCLNNNNNIIIWILL